MGHGDEVRCDVVPRRSDADRVARHNGKARVQILGQLVPPDELDERNLGMEPVDLLQAGPAEGLHKHPPILAGARQEIMLGERPQQSLLHPGRLLGLLGFDVVVGGRAVP